MAEIEGLSKSSENGAETSDTSSDHEIVFKKYPDKRKSCRRLEKNAKQREHDDDGKFYAILEEMREDRKLMMAMMERMLRIEEGRMGIDGKPDREEKSNSNTKKEEDDQTIPKELEIQSEEVSEEKTSQKIEVSNDELEMQTERQGQIEKPIVARETAIKGKEIKVEQTINPQIRMSNIPYFGSSIHIQIFKGDPGENPDVHLDSVKEFLCLHQMTEKEKITVASHYLKESAKAWWKLLKNPPITIQGYENALLKRYWSEEKQEGLLHKLSSQKYNENNRQGYAAFFIHQVTILKSLTAFKYTDQHITRIIVHNLPPWVQRMMLGSCPMSFEKTIELLNQIDYGDLSPTKREWEQSHYNARQLKPYIPPDPGRT